MNIKKIVGVGLLLLLAYFVVAQPDQAAASLHNMGEHAKSAGDSASRFLAEVANG